MKRSEILKGWQTAFEKAGLVTGPLEVQAVIADCAAREIEARIKARAKNGLMVCNKHPIGEE